MALYSQYGQQLTRQDKVDVVHGGILSASREAIRQTMRKTKTLYFYNVLYEGGVCDRNIFINGVTPAQQVEALIPYAMGKSGKKIYILAADYNYGQITARWIQKFVADNGGETVGVDFFPLDVADFGSTIAKIQSVGPDLVVAPLVGGAHLSFFRQWAAAGMKDKIPLASTTLGVGNEQKVLTPEEGNGIMVAYNYSQQLTSPANETFKANWRAAYGSSDNIHETAVSTYQGVKTWAKAVEMAGSLDREAVIAALETGISIDGPGGKVTVDPKTHHAVLDVHLMEFDNQQMRVIETLPQRQPIDTQAVCDLQANPNDNTQYKIQI
jgi:branched-chain amino acid transport system substrate-binding protein